VRKISILSRNSGQLHVAATPCACHVQGSVTRSQTPNSRCEHNIGDRVATLLVLLCSSQELLLICCCLHRGAGMASGGVVLARLLVSINRTGLRYVANNSEEASSVVLCSICSSYGCCKHLVDTCTSQILSAAPQNRLDK
jgi:hypothetical protein